MVRGDGLYSRVIGWLKILLPLAALALLSTMFLLSRSREPLENVPFADAVSRGGTAEQAVRGPYYSGTTLKGDLVTMSATRARPLASGEIEADELEARMLLKDGGTLHLTSRLATVRESEDEVLLEGDVQIESSTGYVMTTEKMVSGINRLAAHSLAPVEANGPLGTLTAGRMQIEPGGAGGDVQIHFTDGVKLIYQPPKKEGSE